MSGLEVNGLPNIPFLEKRSNMGPLLGREYLPRKVGLGVMELKAQSGKLAYLPWPASERSRIGGYVQSN